MSEPLVTTVSDLIERLGGPTKAGQVLGGVSTQRVWNWGAAGKLPTELYLEHRGILTGLGIECVDSLWFGERAAPAVQQRAAQ